jgi:hypothetical protein
MTGNETAAKNTRKILSSQYYSNKPVLDITVVPQHFA